MAGVPIRDRRLRYDTQGHRTEGHVTAEEMHLHAKEPLEPPEVGKGRESSPRAFRDSLASRCPDVRLLASRTGTSRFLLFQVPRLWTLVSAAPGRAQGHDAGCGVGQGTRILEGRVGRSGESWPLTEDMEAEAALGRGAWSIPGKGGHRQGWLPASTVRPSLALRPQPLSTCVRQSEHWAALCQLF